MSLCPLLLFFNPRLSKTWTLICNGMNRLVFPINILRVYCFLLSTIKLFLHVHLRFISHQLSYSYRNLRRRGRRDCHCFPNTFIIACFLAVSTVRIPSNPLKYTYKNGTHYATIKTFPSPNVRFDENGCPNNFSIASRFSRLRRLRHFLIKLLSQLEKALLRYLPATTATTTTTTGA